MHIYFSMKAVVISKPGGPSVLKLEERSVPTLQGDEVLVAVHAAGVNRPDVAQREGNYPPPLGTSQDIPGLEVAGIVAQCGTAVTRWKVGDRVCALVAGGGYADFVAVNAGQCLPIPGNLDFAGAAGLPETTFTVWHNLFQRGGLQEGETLLLHGGSSGIGITAIQLAKAFGAKVIVTVGSAEKGEACLKLGAEQYLNYKTQDFKTTVPTNSIDVILDMIGGDYFAGNIDLLKPEGRLVYINAMQGSKVTLDLWQVMQKRIKITGSTLRARESGFKIALSAEIEQYVWPLIEAGVFKPVIYKTFPFAQAAAAHELMESSMHIGKIILINE